MPEQEKPTSKTEKTKRKSFQIGQIVNQSYRPPKGKIPENSRWMPFRRHPDKNYIEAWQLQSTLPEIPTQDELPPQKPPEVIAEEIKQAKIDDWHRYTD